MKSSTHIFCKFIRLLETIFSSRKTIPTYLQYGNELFASWLCQPPLTGLPGPDQSPIGHPWDILGWRTDDSIPSQLPHFPNLNASWLNSGNVFHEGLGYNPRLLLSIRKSLMECIHKCGGHTRYDLHYINL